MKRVICIVTILIMVLSGVAPVSADNKIGEKVNINGIEAVIVGYKDNKPLYQSTIASNIYTSPSDRSISSNFYANYADARANGDNFDWGGSLSLIVSNKYTLGGYQVSRSYLYFNTIPLSGLVINSASINIYVVSRQGAESIQVQSGMPTYPNDPLVLSDYNASYAGNGGSVVMSALTEFAYNAITLNATGYGWINTSGTTKYCLRADGDINNVAPTIPDTVIFNSSENGSSTSPYLTVTYTVGTPAIDSVAVSNKAANSARLNSSVISDGGDTACTIEFGYGTTSETAVNYAAYDHHTSVTIPTSTYKQGDTPYLDVTGLVSGTFYYYRVKITNATTSVVSTTQQSFTTNAVINDMSQLTGYPSKSSDTPIAISLNWLKAVGATNTLIRYSMSSYPTSTSGADGSILVYNDTGTIYAHSGLTAGTTYYYSAWGESGGTYSTNPIHLVLTTNSSMSAGASASLKPIGGLFQEPSETFLVNLQPFYSVINGLADTWGMPRGNMWFMIVMLVILAIGIGLYIKFSSPSLALFVMALVMGGFVTLHILPQFMVFIVLFLALGGWGTRPQI